MGIYIHTYIHISFYIAHCKMLSIQAYLYQLHFSDATRDIPRNINSGSNVWSNSSIHYINNGKNLVAAYRLGRLIGEVILQCSLIPAAYR